MWTWRPSLGWLWCWHDVRVLEYVRRGACDVVTPMDVIKTRVQAAKGSSMGSSFLKMFLSTLKSEGVTALFKGASMRMAVQAPMFAIMTTAFELQKRYIASK